jgi:hypothetical protein
MSVKSTLGWFAGGCGITVIILAIFAFYPPFVLSIAVSRMFFGPPEAMVNTFPADALCLLLFFVFTFIVICLVACEQYFAVLVIYLITAWPFINIIIHWATCGEGQNFPLPIEWLPFSMHWIGWPDFSVFFFDSSPLFDQ